MKRFLFSLVVIFSGMELFGQGTGTVQFVMPDIRVEESAGDVSLFVERTKSNLLPSSVDYRVTRSSATLDLDYSMTTEGTLNWGDGDESLKGIIVTILDDPFEETNEEIIIQLLNPSDGTYLGEADTARVVISGEESGHLGFSMEKFIASEMDLDPLTGERQARILVSRRDGLRGAILVDYEIRELSELDEEEHLGQVTHYRRLPDAAFIQRKVMPGVRAQPFRDFLPDTGTLLFLDYQSSAIISVNLIPNFDGDAYPHTVLEMA
ncbi:MAG TPA: Calx-beta domain-containing protein, partial [Nitrospinaceae bacterium]|nr:Calx-beta domain-containing protein [Nitrospinaceae bacterium]